MRIPAPRHAELGSAPTPGMKSLEQVFDLAAEMGLDGHPRAFERGAQSLGNRGAKQHVNAQFRHAPGQGLDRHRGQDELLALDGPAAMAPHDQQAGGGVEHR